MNTIMRLRDRYGPCAIVTGATDGIGRAFAAQLGAEGFDLILVARRESVLEKMADELRAEYNIRCTALALDLADPTSIAKLIDASMHSDVGLVVAAAGYGTSGPFIESAMDEELGMIDLNCRSIVELAHFYAQRFVSRGGGAIVLLSSLLAFQGVPLSANYAATKAFVQSFAEGLSLEVRKDGVDVLAVAPGPVETGFASRANLRMSAAASPDIVASVSLAALGKKTTVRPGFLAKFLEGSLATLPRPLRTRIMAQVMAGMTRHQQAGAGNRPPAHRQG